MEEKRVYKKIRRVKSHIEADTLEGTEGLGWFIAINGPGSPRKILNGSGIGDDEEDIEGVDAAIEFNSYIRDDDDTATERRGQR